MSLQQFLADSRQILGWPKIRSGFSVTSYGQPKLNRAIIVAKCWQLLSF